ncbi:MAG: VF530 family DNA-binding protein [Candidatus Pelagadaptatus aseana]
MIEVQRNNPLHGVKLEALVTELVEHYGWEVLASEFNFNCFKSNPSIKSSLKFLRKTPWAREKIESFYLYQYKGLPRASVKEEELPPRDRTIPLDQKPGEPMKIKARPKREKPVKTKSEKDLSDIWGHWRK